VKRTLENPNLTLEELKNVVEEYGNYLDTGSIPEDAMIRQISNEIFGSSTMGEMAAILRQAFWKFTKNNI